MDLAASASRQVVKPACGASRGVGPLLYVAWRRILQSEEDPSVLAATCRWWRDLDRGGPRRPSARRRRTAARLAGARLRRYHLGPARQQHCRLRWRRRAGQQAPAQEPTNHGAVNQDKSVAHRITLGRCDRIFAEAQAFAAESRPSRPCRTIASGDARASTIASPSAGSLERTAASKAPQAAPAICAKPNKAAATPALSPKGDRAAALASGLAMPRPNRKIAAPTTNGRNALRASQHGEKKRCGADDRESQADQRCAIEAELCRQAGRQHAGSQHEHDDGGEHQADARPARIRNVRGTRAAPPEKTANRPAIRRPDVLAGTRNRASRKQAKIGSADRKGIYRSRWRTRWFRR